MQQTTNTILMVRPINFRMNEQTAVNNYFQEDLDIKNAEINKKAQQEFDDFVTKLENHGINVIVISDTEEFDTPDSIFPNNWISFHQNGTVGLYPMFAENRRVERREDILEELVLCVTSATELVETNFGKRISLGLSIFWFIRLIFQLFVYSSLLWKGKKFETIMHTLFTAFWIYISAIFCIIYFN